MDDMVVEDSQIEEFSKATTEHLVEASQDDRQFVSKCSIDTIQNGILGNQIHQFKQFLKMALLK